jgi:TonB-dependent SusC/RagA subfamily outer membrane receptor
LPRDLSRQLKLPTTFQYLYQNLKPNAMKKLMLFVLLFVSVNCFAQSTAAEGERQAIKIINKSGKDKDAQPLLVLDGVVLNTPTEAEFQKQIKAIDPNSIEKIDVLKGESATKTIYGEKALNGVILITTKKK